jgi:uncharacterized oxidoreductase
MNTTNNTILITGGSAGIGFETARLLSEKGNHVIITGRNEERLKNAVSKLRHVTAIVSDISEAEDVNALVNRVQKDFPGLNVVINNAGRAFVYDLAEEGINAFEKAQDEMLTNFFSVIRLNEKLLPLLKKQPEAAIVNVSSIVAFAPGISLATYAASKAAVHSYSQALRLTLERTTAVKVFELMPPLVNTEFSQEIGGSNGIHPSVVAGDLLKALEANEYEIHVGATAEMYQLFLSSPAAALQAINSRR